MRLPTFFLTLAAAAALACGSEAQTPPLSTPSEGMWTFTPSVASAYLFRGVNLAGPSLQPALDYTAGKFSAGLWSSVALHDRSRVHSNPEVDWFATYARAIPSAHLSLVSGFTLYTYPTAARGDFYPITFEPSLAAVFLIHGVQITPKFYYDLTLESLTTELNASLALPLKHLGTELDFAATAGTFETDRARRRDRPATKNSGDYWSISISLPVQVSLSSKVVVGFTYSDGRHNFFKNPGFARELNSDAGGHAAASLSYAITY